MHTINELVVLFAGSKETVSAVQHDNISLGSAEDLHVTPRRNGMICQSKVKLAKCDTAWTEPGPGDWRTSVGCSGDATRINYVSVSLFRFLILKRGASRSRKRVCVWWEGLCSWAHVISDDVIPLSIRTYHSISQKYQQWIDVHNINYFEVTYGIQGGALTGSVRSEPCWGGVKWTLVRCRSNEARVLWVLSAIYVYTHVSADTLHTCVGTYTEELFSWHVYADRLLVIMSSGSHFFLDNICVNPLFEFCFGVSQI